MAKQTFNGRDILKILEIQTEREWLVDLDNYRLLQLTKELILDLQKIKLVSDRPLKILLIESDPLKFIAGFLAAAIAECSLFLGNPNWQKLELQQVQKLLQPELIWCSDRSLKPTKNQTDNIAAFPLIGIPTGGSSGKLKFSIHSIQTLTASVRGFSDYFKTTSINSCCTLPLYHVSGLMQIWRSLISQGNLAVIPYKNIKQGIVPDILPQDYFLSLVPTQLQLLLNKDPDWLRQFKTILLGGAPAWRSLLNQSRQHKISIATTYGMTETASGVTYLKPQSFLGENYSSGKTLPHAKIEIISQNGKILEPNQTGIIKIQADSLHHGYYPEHSLTKKTLIADDLGFLDAEGFLHVVGRNSQKIITGGENVYPQEIEAAILGTKLVKDVCVIGLNDPKWGQVVTAIFVPLDIATEIALLQQQLQQCLSKYKQPKRWLQVDYLPRDAKGKINYSQLAIIAKELQDKI